jgi:formate dehydrogenase iron-sulfur subunit
MRALLFDVTKCVGCGACDAACTEANKLPEQEVTDLSANKFTVLKTMEAEGEEMHYRRMCMHCNDPACVSVCPVLALEKTPAGPVVYDAGRCMGCRYCVQACAFNVPRYEWNSLTPRVRKCQFCDERLAKGEINACAEACPAGATIAGEREELLREARARLAAEPDTYVQKIYGEHEAGGTSVLFLSPVPFEQLGLPVNLTSEPLPLTTFRVLSKIPAVVGAGAAVLTGLYWITKRKQEVAMAEGRITTTVKIKRQTPVTTSKEK